MEAVVRAATRSIAAASAAASAVTSSSSIPGNLSTLKLLHLRFLCGVSSDTDIPTIWSEVYASSSKQAGLAILVQYLMAGM